VLEKSTELCNCSGDPLRELGKGYFQLKIGSAVIRKELVVAKIADEGLLGMDILMDKGKPADLLLSEGVILIQGQNISCETIIQNQSVRRVTVADNEVVPPYSEKLIDVYIQRFQDEGNLEENILITPTERFTEEYPLHMARCLVDTRKETTSKVRVINPYKTEAIIRQNANIAEAEVCTPMEIILDNEDPSQEKYNSAVRLIRVSTAAPDSVLDDCRLESGHPELPPHVGDLYERANKERSESEKRQIFEMLSTYQDVFSRHEDDIGRTDFIEHHIETKDARPIKQPPRRVPLAFAAAEKEYIVQFEKQGVIRKSTSPWASPIVLVKKEKRQS
jgi:hypothetical protein